MLAVELTGWKEPSFIDTLAEALYVNNSFEEAVRTQSKALKLDPDNREFQEHMKKYRRAAAGSSYTYNWGQGLEVGKKNFKWTRKPSAICSFPFTFRRIESQSLNPVLTRAA